MTSGVLQIFFSVTLIWLSNLSKCSSSDPELNMNTTEVVRYYGYPCEIHQVLTEDGYILGLQRIPYGLKNKNTSRPVVFLQHGLSDSSFSWVSNGPKNSLGFILADNGYDVWLGNSRGNLYSRRHIAYDSSSRTFWDFTWDDMAKFDLPASINYALRISKASKLNYVGHSQGGTIGFAKFSTKSGLNSKIASFSAFAPAVYISQTKAALKYLAPLAEAIHLYSWTFTKGQYLPSKDLSRQLKQFVCGLEIGSKFCGHIIFLMQGYNVGNLNLTRIPVYLSHTSAGTSSKNMLHFAQSFLANKFQYFDHGLKENLKQYGQPTPPKYAVTANGIPVAVFWGGNDRLVTPQDVSRLIKELKDEIKLNKYIPRYNHVDFIWGIDAHEVLYPDLLEFLSNYNTL